MPHCDWDRGVLSPETFPEDWPLWHLFPTDCIFGDNSFKSISISRFQCNTDYTYMMDVSSDLGLVRFYCLQNGISWERCSTDSGG